MFGKDVKSSGANKNLCHGDAVGGGGGGSDKINHPHLSQSGSIATNEH